MKNRDVNESLKIFQNLIIEIIKFYDSNKLYLTKLDEFYDKLITSWNDFENITKKVNNPLSEFDKKVLGIKIQEVKNNLNKLNLELDKLMLKI